MHLVAIASFAWAMDYQMNRIELPKNMQGGGKNLEASSSTSPSSTCFFSSYSSVLHFWQTSTPRPVASEIFCSPPQPFPLECLLELFSGRYSSSTGSSSSP